MGSRHAQGETGKLSVVILADDLSGAADSSVGFARQGLRTEVVLEMREGVDADVLALDLDTRLQTTAKACDRVVAGWHWATGLRPQWVYKKIDSKLRGHLVEELIALAGHLDPATLVAVCPAHPDAGVRYRDGRPHLEGVSLLASTDATLAHLASAWEQMGWPRLRSRNDPVASVSGHALGSLTPEAFATAASAVTTTSGPLLALIDAEDAEDLFLIVRTAASTTRPVLLVGSGGLSSALAAHLGPGAPIALPRRIAVRQALLVAGSNASPTRRQLEHLASAGLGDIRWLAGAGGVDACGPAHIAANPIAVAIAGPENVRDANGVAALEPLIEHCLPLARQCKALVLTGGDTARSMLTRLDVHTLQIRGEIETGVVLGRALGGWSGEVITKSGSFGGADALEMAMRYFGYGES